MQNNFVNSRQINVKEFVFVFKMLNECDKDFIFVVVHGHLAPKESGGTVWKDASLRDRFLFGQEFGVCVVMPMFICIKRIYSPSYQIRHVFDAKEEVWPG